MKNIDLLSKTYLYFSSAEGNQHIASEFAILKLQELVVSLKVKSILEVGLGIGAIAGSLLAVNKNVAYSGTEDNEFCLKALKENLGEEHKRLKLYPELNDLDHKTKFDLIIIDGKDFALQQLSELLSPNGIIAIEGDRMEQQVKLQQNFPNHLFVHCISRDKNKDYSPFPSDHWQGGIKTIFINPTFFQKLWWLRERIYTKCKYWFIR